MITLFFLCKIARNRKQMALLVFKLLLAIDQNSPSEVNTGTIGWNATSVIHVELEFSFTLLFFLIFKNLFP